jgi:glycerol-3-phosphate O-acyltransferase
MASTLGLDRLFLGLVRGVLHRMVRFTTSPADAAATGIDRSRPVCYALSVRQLSAYLTLDDATRALGLPRPSVPLVAGSLRESSAFFFLTRSGQPSPLRPNPYRYSERLERLVEATRADATLDVQIVPVSLFWGRAPENQDSILKALFAEGWFVPGPLRQLMRLLIHGRQTLLVFGTPISLRQAVDAAADEPGEAGTALRRVARLLRGEFRRERELAVGPNLSHRQTLVNVVIDSPPVRQAIADEAQRRRVAVNRAELDARRMAVEIASDYSYPFIRAYDIALTALWNRIYNGVEVHRFEDVARTGAGAEIVYVPCHRSHIDYLLLSYVIYYRGLLPPHIAAGVNLNMPVIGALLRKGGAFFLRRSFRGDPLYAAVFGEYLHTIISRGFPIEYFVEGGRSRTGRALPPRPGLLGMTVDSYLRDARRPVVFVPVWIGYEQLMEGDSYVAELSGQAKRKESVLGLLRGIGDLRNRNFGKVHVNIAEPIRLESLLDAHWPAWREETVAPPPPGAGGESPWHEVKARQATVAALGTAIVTRINDAVVVNPVNLLATAMHGARRDTMDADVLARYIDGLKRLLEEVAYSERQTLTPFSGAEVIAYAQSHGLVERIAHPLGDVIRIAPRHAALLAYFRNNVQHVFAVPSLVAGVVARNQRIEDERLAAIARRVLPFLRLELFLSWSDDELDARLARVIDAFVRHGLFTRADGALIAPAPTQREAASLHALAQVLREPLERHFIAVGMLVSFGSGTVSAGALEDVCQLLASRFALLHESGSPDFSDRTSFRSIVRALVTVGLAEERDDRLCFGEALLEGARDADWLLPEDVVQAIAHAGRMSPAELAGAVARGAVAGGGRGSRTRR